MDDKNKHVRDRLMRDHSPSEYGTWRILGEDPNCDFGGAHHEPELETVTGTYANVVEYAMSLSSFFQWGAGGRIKKISTNHKNIDKVFNNPRIKQLEKERADMQARLAVIETELKILNEGK